MIYFSYINVDSPRWQASTGLLMVSVDYIRVQVFLVEGIRFVTLDTFIHHRRIFAAWGASSLMRRPGVLLVH